MSFTHNESLGKGETGKGPVQLVLNNRASLFEQAFS